MPTPSILLHEVSVPWPAFTRKPIRTSGCRLAAGSLLDAACGDAAWPPAQDFARSSFCLRHSQVPKRCRIGECTKRHDASMLGFRCKADVMHWSEPCHASPSMLLQPVSSLLQCSCSQLLATPRVLSCLSLVRQRRAMRNARAALLPGGTC